MSGTKVIPVAQNDKVRLRILPVAELAPAARCTGHCCREFPVSTPLVELSRIAADASRDATTRDEAGRIAAMLVPLGQRRKAGGEIQDVYTCRHHDASSGDCLAYDDRPRMCRDYPYGRSCEHASCTMRGSP